VERNVSSFFKSMVAFLRRSLCFRSSVARLVFSQNDET